MDNGHMTTTPNWRARYEQLEKDHDRTVKAWQIIIAEHERLTLDLATSEAANSRLQLQCNNCDDKTQIQLTEGKVMRAALEDIHQYEGTSYAHARTVAHQGLSGEYSTQVMQSKCQKCGDTYSGAFCPCSYEVQDDDPAQVGQSSDEKGPATDD